MESLCGNDGMLSDDTALLCLRALYCTLDSAWPRKLLGEDLVLSREVLNIMHRYGAAMTRSTCWWSLCGC